MNLKIIAGLVVAAGLMVGCGTTTFVSENQGSKPVTTRAQNYSGNFAQNYVNAVVNTYGITRYGWYGLEQSKASAVANLTSGQTTPSVLRDSFLNQLLGMNLYGATYDRNLQSPESYVDFLYQNYMSRSGPEGRDYWAGMLRGIYGPVMTPSQVRDAFIDSQEYSMRFSNDQFIDSLFRQVLRRYVGYEDRQGWVNYMAASGLKRSQAIRIFLDTAEFGNCQFINQYFYQDIFWTTGAGYRFFPILPGPFPPNYTPMKCN
jgi:hypothetical protein